MFQLRIKRGTRAELSAAAAAGELFAGEPYLITDEDRIAIGTSASTFVAFAKQGEGGGGGTPTPSVRDYASLPAQDFNDWIQGAGNAAALAGWLADPVGFVAGDANNSAIATNLTRNATAAAALLNTRRALALLAAGPHWAMWTGSPVMTATQVPAMTSDSAPSGTVTASSANGGYVGYHAFDQAANIWLPNIADPGEWVAYAFPNPVHIHTAELTPGALGGPLGFAIEYSDDGSNWTPAAEVPSYAQQTGVKTTHTVIAGGRHKHWRLRFTVAGEGFGSIDELQFVGFI